MYYGRRVPDAGMRSLLRQDPDQPPFRLRGDQTTFLDELPTEYSG